ncbi:hypothetical protein [uncultured Treponema sp.]|uniref:hypothetical protein n=1 Tax=uncultured Treponema sp. TaxID=162155 RepID=UPI0015B93951|nr:hypothetical protein [uncultured Treponema sp.]
MSEKSCRKCGAIGVWRRGAAEGRGVNVCVGEKCVWRGAKNNFFLLLWNGFIKADYFIDVGLKYDYICL